MSIKPIQKLLDEIISIAKEAASAILEIYQTDGQYSLKSDGSVLTKADLISHQIITTRLNALTPDIAIISEENNEKESMLQRSTQFWLVDPLDGTKEFINRNDEFTVNIALIENGEPVLGVIFAPALNIGYAGTKNCGAMKFTSFNDTISIKVNPHIAHGLVVVGSRSHGNPEEMDAYLKGQKVVQFLAIGSSLKFCKIAEGSAHLYPRLGRTMEWDTAAGHAILVAAGGTVEDLNGTPLCYGKKNFENPYFVAKAITRNTPLYI